MASPSSGLTAAVGISVLAFSFVSAIIVVAIYCLKRSFSHRSEPIGFISLEQVAWKKEANSIDVPTQARPFQLLEIKVATESFSRKLGEGGFGPVYHGILPDGHEIAVKVQSYDSKQGANEFFNEVQLLSRAHHRHVVSLVGYCHEANSRMLVYEYLSGGTLERSLHGKIARGFLLERRIHKIIDPIFDAVYNIESIWKAAELAMFCVEPRAVHRPAMPEVVQELKQALDIEEGRITVATIEAATPTPLAPVQAAKHHHARSEPVYYHQNTRNFSFGTSEDESYSFSNLREVKTTEGETTT
ncbi:hypothetical protein SELMODRAFT_412421 [Selaginella moellendorffii]|uniref:Protein kinase domain-containing protein n=1 Tax=Selaginella moellendorffii TaxID=88036 RepID=D8RL36_SELML|nr:hypothetical protein SELMODRAFT_412421 [Selaginella moellendorffii]